jgi:hypothetical protein
MRKAFLPFIFAICLILSAPTSCHAETHWWQFLFGPRQSPSLRQETIVAGLKEALQIGSKNAVTATGQPDGYFGNAAIKILMPEKMKKAETILRKLGLGNKVDEFILSMNRAAERAAPAALDIFISAIKEMTFDDAVTIWKGSDTAATDYFRSKAGARLTTAFYPIVAKATDEVKVTSSYKELVNRSKKIPLLKV